eukprot:1824619-Heterocapsa_arctica.AAC.1
MGTNMKKMLWILLCSTSPSSLQRPARRVCLKSTMTRLGLQPRHSPAAAPARAEREAPAPGASGEREAPAHWAGGEREAPAHR